MTPAIISEMIRAEKFASYNALAASAIGISFLLGPLVGGAINDSMQPFFILSSRMPRKARGEETFFERDPRRVFPLPPFLLPCTEL